jgi:O-antigen/teichoic acid export membrane protein
VATGRGDGHGGLADPGGLTPTSARTVPVSLSFVAGYATPGFGRWIVREVASRAPRGGVGRNASWVIGGQAIGLLATLIATPIQLRHMGAERYGIVVIAAAVLSMPFIDIGAGWAVVRAIPWHRARGDESHARRLAGSGLVMAAVGGLAAGALLWTLAPGVATLFRLTANERPAVVAVLHVVAFIVPVTVAVGALAAVVRAAGHFPAIALSRAFVMVALNAVWALVAGQHDDVLLVVRAQLAIAAIALLWMLCVVWLRARSYLFPLRPSIAASRELLSFGGRSTIGLGSLLFLFQADKLVLATVLPVAVLPAYSVPFSVALRITVVSHAFAGVLLPRLSAIASRGDVAEMRRVGVTALRVLALASPAIAVTCAFGGRAFLDLWVNAHFASQAWGPLVALSVGFAALATGSVAGVTLDASGRPGLNAVLTATGAAVGLSLAVILASAFQTALAAAIGMAIGLGLIATSALELSRRLTLEMPRRALLGVLGTPWLALGLAGGASFGMSSALSASHAVTLASVGFASAATAAIGLVRARPPSRVGPEQLGSPL